MTERGHRSRPCPFVKSLAAFVRRRGSPRQPVVGRLLRGTLQRETCAGVRLMRPSLGTLPIWIVRPMSPGSPADCRGSECLSVVLSPLTHLSVEARRSDCDRRLSAPPPWQRHRQSACYCACRCATCALSKNTYTGGLPLSAPNRGAIPPRTSREVSGDAGSVRFRVAFERAPLSALHSGLQDCRRRAARRAVAGGRILFIHFPGTTAHCTSRGARGAGGAFKFEFTAVIPAGLSTSRPPLVHTRSQALLGEDLCARGTSAAMNLTGAALS